jgi:hypothetical protein
MRLKLSGVLTRSNGAHGESVVAADTRLPVRQGTVVLGQLSSGGSPSRMRWQIVPS